MREGRCTTSLVHYLVLTHNDFIERCRGIISQGSESASAVWREHKVPITHVRPCHLLEYEHHLQSIILSHCHYSLTVGRGRNIKYNLPALEKHVLDKFIYGKPVILQDIPNVAYLKDIYTVETFLEIRRKVKPQVLAFLCVKVTIQLSRSDMMLIIIYRVRRHFYVHVCILSHFYAGALAPTYPARYSD